MFFANSASIKPVLPQASQLRNNIFIRYQFCFTSVRDPIKDTLQRDRERKKPSTQLEPNPQPLESLLMRSALYHFYNLCP